MKQYYPVAQCSAKAMQAKDNINVGRLKYPFSQLNTGECFTIPSEGANVKSLKVLAAKYSTDGKRFVIIEHAEHKLIEVARIE
jgi:hypothetical protein